VVLDLCNSTSQVALQSEEACTVALSENEMLVVLNDRGVFVLSVIQSETELIAFLLADHVLVNLNHLSHSGEVASAQLSDVGCKLASILLPDNLGHVIQENTAALFIFSARGINFLLPLRCLVIVKGLPRCHGLQALNRFEENTHLNVRVLACKSSLELASALDISLCESILKVRQQRVVLDHFQIVVHQQVRCLDTLCTFNLVLVGVFGIFIEQEVSITVYTDPDWLRLACTVSCLGHGGRFSRHGLWLEQLDVRRSCINRILNLLESLVDRREGIEHGAVLISLKGSLATLNAGHSFFQRSLEYF
jgi:hypothetical protein